MKNEGNFKQGKMDGSWKAWFPNKSPNYEGFYSTEERQITLKYTYKDKAKRDSVTCKSGNWKYYYDNGKVKEEGPYKSGEKEGHWVFWTSFGFKDMEGDYKEEKQNGLWTYYYETGVKSMEQTFKDGKLSGDCSSWYEDAKLKSTTSYTLVKDSKKLRVESKPNGKWTYYDKNGNIMMETTYKKGEKVN